MGFYYSLNYQKSRDKHSKEEEVSVIIFYYFQGKKMKISTGVSVLLKDWNSESENPVKRSDPKYKFKNPRTTCA